ncbi:MAG: hypothetical protein R3181_14900 [Rubricoccaceae bacterium]|nr:hypothetical protein [Rubricoccaceae bacterium]
MRSLLALLVLAGCMTTASPEAPPPPDGAPPADAVSEDRTVSGTVTALDFSPMAYDADGVVTVETDEGETVDVQLPARYGLCAASYDDWAELAVGDRVEARGAVTMRGAVRPCEREDHRFRIL